MSTKPSVCGAFGVAAAALTVVCAPAQAQVGAFENLVSPGALSKAHETSDATCNSCHASFDKAAQPRLCAECHKDVAADIASRRGFHGKAPNLAKTACKACHTEHKGAAFDIARFDDKTFDHAVTDYPLTGGHAGIACQSCHQPGKKFREAPGRCGDCHRADDPHKGSLGQECQSCHYTADWRRITFDHSKTKFPLFGKHQPVVCSACHADQKFKGVSTACIDCHRADDSHNGAFGTACETCHSAEGWTIAKFDHGGRTGFVLNGKHAAADCLSCHTKSLTDPKLDRACIACHRKDDAHKGRNGARCAGCHSENSWTKAHFDHNTQTKFPLRGAHVRVTCDGCHIEAVTKILPGRACIDCHREDDPHKGGQGELCATCHNEISWTATVRFDHDLSSFPLLGKHRNAPCDGCHLSREFSETPDDCVSCHREDDIHGGALGADCGECHNPNGWVHWAFDHNEQTDFPLDGAHEGLKCVSCHRAPAIGAVGTSSACVSCHRADDKHQGRYGRTCERCHVTETFRNIRLP